MSERINRLLTDFMADRPVMAQNNSLDKIKEYLLLETQEVMEAKNTQELEEEFSDVIIFAWNALLSLGIDPEEAVVTKIAANHLQHPAHFYKNGDYYHQRPKAKELANREQVKKTIYDNS